MQRLCSLASHVVLVSLLGAFGYVGQSPQTLWYTVSFGGTKTGYSQTQYSPGQTDTAQKMVFKRLGSVLTMKASSSVHEDSAGAIRSFHGEMTSSNSTTVCDGVVVDSLLKLKITAGGKSYTREVPFKDVLVGPQAADRRSSVALRKPGEHLEYQTIEPTSGAVCEVSRTVDGIDSFGGPEHPVRAVRVHEIISWMGVDHTIWLDPDAHLIKSRDQSPLGEAVIERSTSSFALSSAGGGVLKSEVYSRTVAKTNIRLPDPRSLERVVLKLTNRRPELAWPDLESDTQHILSEDSRTAVVEVVKPNEPTAHQRNATAGQAASLSANELIQSDDSGVRTLAKSIVGTERDPWKAALKLRDWETTHVSMDAGIAIAASSEVARDHRGTCFAFSTLLAGMCRSLGIPARFVMGFGYVEGMYGGHAWVDVKIGDKWIPIDAALYGPGAADAARLRCLTSTLDGGYPDLQSGLKAYGNLGVEILGYTVHGAEVKVPAHAAPYEVNGGRYTNEWLCIQVNLPRGYRYADLDCTYPDSTIFTATRYRTKLTLEQNPVPPGPQPAWPDVSVGTPRIRHLIVSGCRTSIGGNTTDAKAAIRDGQTIWLLKAKGPGAEKALSQALRSWRIANNSTSHSLRVKSLP